MDSSKTDWQHILPGLVDLEQENSESLNKIKPLNQSIESIRSISYTIDESPKSQIIEEKLKDEKISSDLMSNPIPFNLCQTLFWDS